MINPLIFDCPPPVYEETQDTGWESIAKAIVTNQSSLTKLIKHAKRIQRKQKILPFTTLRLFNTPKRGLGTFTASERRKAVNYSGAFCSFRARKKAKVDPKTPHPSKKCVSFSREKLPRPSKLEKREFSHPPSRFFPKRETLRPSDRSAVLKTERIRYTTDSNVDDTDSIDSRKPLDSLEEEFFEENEQSEHSEIKEQEKEKNQEKHKKHLLESKLVRDKYRSQRFFWKKMRQKKNSSLISKLKRIHQENLKSLEILKKISRGSFDETKIISLGMKRHSSATKNMQTGSHDNLKIGMGDNKIIKLNLKKSRTNSHLDLHSKSNTKSYFYKSKSKIAPRDSHSSHVKFCEDKSVILEESTSSCQAHKSPKSPLKFRLFSPLHRQIKPCFQINYVKFRNNQITKKNHCLQAPKTQVNFHQKLAVMRPDKTAGGRGDNTHNLLTKMKLKRQIHNDTLRRIYDNVEEC
ncbi:unnamed protein product [Moneuplotes crassus]|uniref:Uncharacterized protein n=1 Tax=Euplotes crassus TaxID=5936 RepID=A0AAD1U370_EUPCR|nr:unnamed protein product [Moneuplotes crassus]